MAGAGRGRGGGRARAASPPPTRFTHPPLSRPFPQVTLVILRGADDSVFCTGADARGLRRALSASPGERGVALGYLRAAFALQHLIAHYSKPLVSGLHGLALGSGAAVALNARFTYAVAGATVAFPEVRAGLLPHGGAAYHLARAPGGLGMFLATTGGALSGEEAY